MSTYFLISFVAKIGLDIPLLLQRLFANDVSTFFAVYLIITILVFWVYLYAET